MLLNELTAGKILVYSLTYTQIKTDEQDGGRCVVGCHNPRQYDRGKKEERVEEISSAPAP